jgi:ketosteroid isomerase-like protein
MAEPNAERLRRGYDALANHDSAAVRALLAEDVTWRVPGRGPLAGDYHGHEHVLALLARRRQLSSDTFRIKVLEMLADHDLIAVICTVSAERFGQYWAAPALHLWRMRNEKATDVCEFQLDQHGEQEFWAA